MQQGMVSQVCNPSYSGLQIRKIAICGGPRQEVARYHFNQWLSEWCVAVISATRGSTNRTITVQVGLWVK
jgi:hypothetical protein